MSAELLSNILTLASSDTNTSVVLKIVEEERHRPHVRSQSVLAPHDPFLFDGTTTFTFGSTFWSVDGFEHVSTLKVVSALHGRFKVIGRVQPSPFDLDDLLDLE